jgi:prepilin peptidase CpaA
MNATIPFLALVLIIAVLCDIRSHRIPNWLTFSAIAAGIGYHLYLSGLQGFLFGIGGVAAGMALLMLFYLCGGMGAGDVKLMGAVGALLGPAGVFWSCLYTALVGGIYALIVLIMNRRRTGQGLRYKDRAKGFLLTQDLSFLAPQGKDKGPVLCYGVAIALGTFMFIFKDSYLR